jgi:hypothetical protein
MRPFTNWGLFLINWHQSATGNASRRWRSDMSDRNKSNSPRVIFLRIIAGGTIGVVGMGLLGYVCSLGCWDRAVGPAIFGLIAGVMLGPILMDRRARRTTLYPTTIRRRTCTMDKETKQPYLVYVRLTHSQSGKKFKMDFQTEIGEVSNTAFAMMKALGVSSCFLTTRRDMSNKPLNLLQRLVLAIGSQAYLQYYPVSMPAEATKPSHM